MRRTHLLSSHQTSNRYSRSYKKVIKSSKTILVLNFKGNDQWKGLKWSSNIVNVYHIPPDLPHYVDIDWWWVLTNPLRALTGKNPLVKGKRYYAMFFQICRISLCPDQPHESCDEGKKCIRKNGPIVQSLTHNVFPDYSNFIFRK